MHRSGTSALGNVRLHAAWEDEALVEGLRQGDKQAFAEIYSRYSLGLLHQAYSKVNSREVAEEMVQELFTALWHKREKAQIEKLPEYLGSAIKYRVINFIKSKVTQQAYLAYCRTVASEADHRTEQELAATDLALALRQGLAKLPGHTREVFQLSRLEHQSVSQIADHLHLSPKTVEYHLTRALKSLRVYLKDFLVLVSLFFAA